MALPERCEIFRKTGSEELDLLEANYYKLPFCDEDMKQFEDMENNSDDWVNTMLEDRFMNGNNELLTPASPSSSSGALSPSSSSSASSSGNGNEHAYSLINDRPDTPLTAVKFEEFSNDYHLNDFAYNGIKNEYLTSFSSLSDDFTIDPEQNEAKSFQLDGGSDLNLDDEEPMRALNASISTVNASQHTMDRSLSSTLDGSNIITISKSGNTVTVKKENDHDEPMDYSFDKLQESGKHSQVFSTERKEVPKTTRPSQLSVFRLTPDPAKTSSESFSTNTHFLTQPQATQHATFTTVPATSPTAKVTTNALTHRTQIQIPTSTLQTILKSGKLITRLQQEGQFPPRIKIKTEPCDGETQQYVRICQPRIDVQLPPTPPSSNTSDNESTSSPRGVSTSVGPDTQTIQLTANLRELSSATLATQLLTSPQRLTQSHGPLHLTEEEKRTLESEGYPIPESLPLTKVEEKALKKVRRKIKNKISAQESRRKKKEYVEALERKMESYNQENGDLRRKLDSLENSNQNLLGQLRSLQLLVAEKMAKPSRSVTTQTSSCLMVIVLCFAVFLGGWVPSLSPMSSRDSVGYRGTSHPLNVMRTWRSRVIESYSSEQFDDAPYCAVSRCQRDKNEDYPSTTQEFAVNEKNPNIEEGADTYDEPASGRVVMNDTKDQIIANTMEPRDVAAVLASRKVTSNGRKVEMAAVDVMGDESKKVISVVQKLVTE